jgi:hypothetical protein
MGTRVRWRRCHRNGAPLTVAIEEQLRAIDGNETPAL